MTSVLEFFEHDEPLSPFLGLFFGVSSTVMRRFKNPTATAEIGPKWLVKQVLAHASTFENPFG
jgi:hypothetical protein